MQVDPKMESTANFGGYVFGAGNPVMFVDPLGLLASKNEGGPPDQGTGDGGEYMDQWAYILGVLIDSKFGGSWGGAGTGGGPSFFNSDEEATNAVSDANYVTMDNITVTATVNSWKKTLDKLVENGGPGPKHPPGKVTNNAYLNAVFTIRTPYPFKGDLIGFSYGYSKSIGGIKGEGSFGLVLKEDGLKARMSLSGSIMNRGVEEKIDYDPNKNEFSDNFDTFSPGANTKSWSLDMFGMKIYGEYAAAAVYLSNLGHTVTDYFHGLFNEWLHKEE